MEKSRNRAFLVTYAGLLILLFYGLVRILDTAGRKFFMLEFIGLLVLVLISLIAFMSYGKRQGRTLFFVIFLLYLVNLVLVWYFTNALYLVLVILAVLGFVISFPLRHTQKVHVKKVEEKKEELHSMVFEDEPKEETVKTKSKSTTYSPGKYVASKNSNVYHEPKCDWAKKIEKSRQVWFDDKKDAIEKGFRMHSCIE